jgi:hypothetical protein
MKLIPHSIWACPAHGCEWLGCTEPARHISESAGLSDMPCRIWTNTLKHAGLNLNELLAREIVVLKSPSGSFSLQLRRFPVIVLIRRSGLSSHAPASGIYTEMMISYDQKQAGIDRKQGD